MLSPARAGKRQCNLGDIDTLAAPMRHWCCACGSQKANNPGHAVTGSGDVCCPGSLLAKGNFEDEQMVVVRAACAMGVQQVVGHPTCAFGHALRRPLLGGGHPVGAGLGDAAAAAARLLRCAMLCLQVGSEPSLHKISQRCLRMLAPSSCQLGPRCRTPCPAHSLGE